MTKQAVVVSKKMDTPTAVVAMLGIESLSLSSEFILGPSGSTKTDVESDYSTIELQSLEKLNSL